MYVYERIIFCYFLLIIKMGFFMYCLLVINLLVIVKVILVVGVCLGGRCCSGEVIIVERLK